MTYGELIVLLREDFLNDVSDAVSPAEEDYRWPTNFLLRSLYEAERQVCRRKQDAIYDEETAAIVNPTVTASQRTMTIDDRIIDIAWMTIGSDHDKVIEKTTRQRLDEEEPMWRNNTDEQYPTKFFIAANKVYWNYLPSSEVAADTVNLGVWRYPLAEKDIEEEPEVEGHRDLIHWVLFECFSKQDPASSETQDMESANKHLGLFNMAFGKPMGHDVLASKKEAPRGFSMRGPSYFGNMSRRGSELR